ncbi:CRAL/TRIO domain-containing protein [Choiromyces venosus 120613-1]|uniref:Phosphatidylinositol transfer protein SFH5 n=1 Tax=Choiromyces venosus 120613-1 TaxID=1336337 RepID=A0A3N4JQK3_9PEZI|nr:CRAL/TRIO domain-containing protein [Choiromyces venosus 120613-1]
MWGVTLSTDPEDFHTKLILQKFLRGNKNDVAAAEKQFVETIKWRRGYFDADGKVIGTWDEKRFAGLGWITKEKLRNSDQEVVVTWNIYGAVKNFNETFGDVDEFIRWRVTLMEHTIDLLELGSAKTPIPEKGADPYKAFQIHDYLQVSFLRSPPIVKAASRKAIDLFQNYYPELLDKKFFVNVPLLMGWMFSAMKMVVNKDTFKKLYMLSSGGSLAGELNSETIPEEYGGKGVKLSIKGMTIGPDGQLIQPEQKAVETDEVTVVEVIEAPKGELTPVNGEPKVAKETEESKAPEEPKVAEETKETEEPKAAEETKETEEPKETAKVGQVDGATEAVEPTTDAAPATAPPATNNAPPATTASVSTEAPVEKPSTPVEPETDVPPPVPAKNSGEQQQPQK